MPVLENLILVFHINPKIRTAPIALRKKTISELGIVKLAALISAFMTLKMKAENIVNATPLFMMGFFKGRLIGTANQGIGSLEYGTLQSNGEGVKFDLTKIRICLVHGERSARQSHALCPRLEANKGSVYLLWVFEVKITCLFPPYLC